MNDQELDKAERDVREQTYRIAKLILDSVEVSARTKWLPWQVGAACTTAGAALMGAAIVIVKFFLP